MAASRAAISAARCEASRSSRATRIRLNTGRLVNIRHLLSSSVPFPHRRAGSPCLPLAHDLYSAACPRRDRGGDTAEQEALQPTMAFGADEDAVGIEALGLPQ